MVDLDPNGRINMNINKEIYIIGDHVDVDDVALLVNTDCHTICTSLNNTEVNI